MVRRADRLFQIVQFLRSRQLTTARWLAEQLQVSERTIYRDVQDLSLSGVPIEAETGVGYRIKKTYNLPPIIFDQNEINVLVLGMRMVAAQGGNIQRLAESALAKIYQNLPSLQQTQWDNVNMFAPSWGNALVGELIDILNRAILEQRVLLMHYQKPQDQEAEERSVYPLGLFYWGNKWTMVAWCLLRNDFRHFRLDRICTYKVLEEKFVLLPHQTLATFLESLCHSPA